MMPATPTNGTAPTLGAEAVSTPDLDELEFLLDILAAAAACLKDADPAARIAGCALVGGLALPLVIAAEDGSELAPLWDAAMAVEGRYYRDLSLPVRHAARAALQAIEEARKEVEA